MERKLFRQGDVLIASLGRMPVSKDLAPVTPDARGRIVLAEGEATGHAHTLPREHVKTACRGTGGDLFLRVAAPTVVTHDEHDAIPLAPGTYHVMRQREYEPAGIRNVAD